METAEITNKGLESGGEGGWRPPCQALMTLCSSPRAPITKPGPKFLVTRQLQGGLSGQSQRVSEGGVSGARLSYWLVQDTAQLKIKDD